MLIQRTALTKQVNLKPLHICKQFQRKHDQPNKPQNQFDRNKKKSWIFNTNSPKISLKLQDETSLITLWSMVVVSIFTYSPWLSQLTHTVNCNFKSIQIFHFNTTVTETDYNYNSYILSKSTFLQLELKLYAWKYCIQKVSENIRITLS